MFPRVYMTKPGALPLPVWTGPPVRVRSVLEVPVVMKVAALVGAVAHVHGGLAMLPIERAWPEQLFWRCTMDGDVGKGIHMAEFKGVHRMWVYIWIFQLIQMFCHKSEDPAGGICPLP